ncbi:MAG: hypothetical protein ACJ754_03690 [Pyrinomonadaceae bacterium]
MANETKRLRPGQIAEDEDGFAALQAIATYEPANLAYGLPAVGTAHGLLLSARTEEAQAVAALDTARDIAVGREWEFHNLMLRVKEQVTAQFGPDSNEVQALGRKKTSERKSPQRKKTGGATNS